MLQSCEDDILAVEYIYASFDEKNFTKKLDRLRSCRTGAFFYRNSETGAVRVGSQSCHLRHCPLCSKTKVLTIKENVTGWLKKARYPKLVTFTLRHSENPISEQIDKLYESFKAIRRNGIIKNSCYGGIWFFQIKKSENDGLFHPHIHCLVAGKYIPQSKLAQKWFHITGDSHVVDVRMVKDPATCARHVSRYAANPCSLKPLNLDECVTIAEALDNRRLCGTWGECRKLKLTSIPEIDKTHWHKIASWSAVIENKDCDDNAKAILDAWRKGEPLAANIDMDHLYRDDSNDNENLERGSPTIDCQTWIDWSTNL